MKKRPKSKSYHKLTDLEKNRFNIALHLNKLKKSQFCYRLSINYGSFRVYWTKDSNRSFPEDIYKAILDYTNKVYQMAIDGISPAKYEILPKVEKPEPGKIKYLSQKEILQIVAENVPELFEYIENNDVIYMGIQCRNHNHARHIFKMFRKRRRSVVKKVAYLKRPRKNVVVLVTESYNVNVLKEEYIDVMESLFGNKRHQYGIRRDLI